jgi:hypothetical protein
MKKLWEAWKLIARAIGNFQSHVLLTVFYFGLLGPIALVHRTLADPLELKIGSRRRGWTARPSDPGCLDEARKQ